MNEPDPDLYDDIDDEGLGSETSSLLSTIATEYKLGEVVDGRTYATYGTHLYVLPIDDDELDRLDLNHDKYTLLLEGKLYIAPIVSDPQKILDIGTGTGIWAIDMADKFSSAEVIGADIAPVQPQWIPPNCQFILEDAEADWTFKPDSFDFIHSRDLYHSIRNWPRLLKQALNATRPGGYVQFSSMFSRSYSDHRAIDPNSGFKLLAQAFLDIGEKVGSDPDAPMKLKGWFEDAGFENVTEMVYKLPSSPWPKDPRLKKVGALELLNVF